jgi:hypothetical protein
MIHTSALRYGLSSLALLLAACVPGGGAGGTGDGTGNGTASCASMSEQWQTAIVNLQNRCTTVADCMVVGEPGGCGCAATIAGDCGAAVARASYIGSQAEELAQRFAEAGCSFPSVCGCAPTALACSSEGQCVFTHQYCPAGSDAGAADITAGAEASLSNTGL